MGHTRKVLMEFKCQDCFRVYDGVMDGGNPPNCIDCGSSTTEKVAEHPGEYMYREHYIREDEIVSEGSVGRWYGGVAQEFSADSVQSLQTMIDIKLDGQVIQ